MKDHQCIPYLLDFNGGEVVTIIVTDKTHKNDSLFIVIIFIIILFFVFLLVIILIIHIALQHGFWSHTIPHHSHTHGHTPSLALRLVVRNILYKDEILLYFKTLELGYVT